MPDLSPLVPLLGFVAAMAGILVAARNYRRAAFRSMREAYADLAGDVQCFNNTLRARYGEFRKTLPNAPGELDLLIDQAGPPPGLPTNELLSWPDRHCAAFTPDQEMLWQFCRSMYAPRDPSAHAPEVPSTTPEEFHRARGSLSHFWERHAADLGPLLVRRTFESNRRQILMLTWLECALEQWTHDPGPGKVALFMLATGRTTAA